MIDWCRIVYRLVKYRKVIRDGGWVSAMTVPVVMMGTPLTSSKQVVGQFVNFSTSNNHWMLLMVDDSLCTVWIDSMTMLSDEDAMIHKLSK